MRPADQMQLAEGRPPAGDYGGIRLRDDRIQVGDRFGLLQFRNDGHDPPPAQHLPRVAIGTFGTPVRYFSFRA